MTNAARLARTRMPPRGEIVRHAIISAAYRLFVEHGFARVSAEEIADAARTSRRTLYNKFLGKEHLYRVVFEPVLDRLEAAAPTEPCGGDRLRDIADHYTATMSVFMALPETIDLLSLLVRDADLQPWLAEAYSRRIRTPIRETFQRDVQRLIDTGRLPGADPAMLCEQFFGTTMGLMAFPRILRFTRSNAWSDATSILRVAVDSLVCGWERTLNIRPTMPHPPLQRAA